MESPSGALNENTNGSSQLSAGGAGRWCEAEKCGFHVTSPKMGVLDLILFITCPGAELGHFVRETYLCSLGPSIQRNKKGQTNTRSSSYERFIDFFESTSAWVCIGKRTPFNWGPSRLRWGFPKAWVGMEDGVDKRIYIYILVQISFNSRSFSYCSILL